MKRLIIFMALIFLNSCFYPYYRQKKLRSYRSDKSSLSIDDIKISSFHFSAGQRKGSLREITDTLTITDVMDSMLQVSLTDYGFIKEELVYDESLAILIDPEIRWNRRRLVEFLERQSFSDNTLVPIVCYNVSLEPEKSGGGGIVHVYETGNDRYNSAQELYLALFQEDKLLFLHRVIRWDEKIVPAGTPITHEFPQAVLDTLMHMALEPLLKQMDNNAAKQQKR